MLDIYHVKYQAAVWEMETRMINGTVYGVILNDSEQLRSSADRLAAAPYGGAPRAPVLYIKPRTCVTVGSAPVPVPAALESVEIAATLGLCFARNLVAGNAADARQAVGSLCLALDVSEPHDDFFRPAVRRRCRDGFLPLGPFGAAPASLEAEIATSIDGTCVHRWSLERLARPVWELAAEISKFMTLAAGDLLLVGLPGDAPRAAAGSSVAVSGGGLPPLTTRLVEAAA